MIKYFLQDLPRHRWEYRFIKDNVWTFSKYHPTCKDEKGNINNYIDTTDYDRTKLIKERNKENVSPSAESNGCSNKKRNSVNNSQISNLNFIAHIIYD